MTDTAASIFETLARQAKPTLTELFAGDPDRASRFSHRLDLGGSDLLFDLSKTHLENAVLAPFEALAAAADLESNRKALLSGAVVNPTEGRAAEHSAERGIGSDDAVDRARRLRERMAMLVDAIDAGALGDITQILHIGIGGSALGPKLAIDALGRDDPRYDVKVVSNVDGAALAEAFDALNPQQTLVVVASKTFTTTETLMNAASALAWLRDGGVDDPYGRVVALTADPDKALEWGVDESRILPFSESVGGRYSLWSSIGFPIALALGMDAFEEMLRGAAAMDRHFASAPLTQNIPVLAAFADLYYVQARGCQTRAVFAYDERLRLLPDYLQQLEMESNGKSVSHDGEPVSYPTVPVTWGGVGTDAQHAVFQLLHQGRLLVPVEFVAVRQPGHDLDPEHHRALLINCFAQGAALMAGRPSDDAARAYSGDRPSMTVLLDSLDPAAFGALIAFYEHRTFVNAVLLGINPFDQFGVELGKEIAKSIGNTGADALDASTRALIEAAGL